LVHTIQDYKEIEADTLYNKNSFTLDETVRRAYEKLIKSKVYSWLLGTQAIATFNTYKPSFMFVFDTKIDPNSIDITNIRDAHTPEDFYLIKLKVAKKTREFSVQKTTVITPKIPVGENIKNAFTSHKIKEGTYKVTMIDPLPKGEYCFIVANSPKNPNNPRVVYPFSVQ
jgi:hypothetical protein